jgi:hypothetical protein
MTGELIASGLHFEKALFARRYRFDDQNSAVVEHRVFISRNVSFEKTTCQTFPTYLFES